MIGDHEQPTNYWRKLSVLYATRYGQVSALVATVVVVVSFVVPKVLPIYVAVMVVLIMLPPSRNSSLAELEVLDLMGDSKSVQGGLIYWFPGIFVISVLIILILYYSGLYEYNKINSLSLYNRFLSFFCGLDLWKILITHGRIDGIRCVGNYNSLVHVFLFISYAWIVIANLFFSYLTRGIIHSSYPFKNKPLINLVSFVFFLFSICLMIMVFFDYEFLYIVFNNSFNFFSVEYYSNNGMELILYSLITLFNISLYISILYAISFCIFYGLRNSFVDIIKGCLGPR